MSTKEKNKRKCYSIFVVVMGYFFVVMGYFFVVMDYFFVVGAGFGHEAVERGMV